MEFEDGEAFAAAVGGQGYSRQGMAQALAELRSRIKVRFRYDAVEDPAKSKELGRPFFVNAEMVTITTPEDNTNIIDKVVTDAERKMYAPQYAAFLQQNRAKAQAGTPIDALYLASLSPADISNYKACSVFTVEQLAALSDPETERFIGGKQHRAKAKEYLDFSKQEAPLAAMREALTKKDSEIAALKAQVRDLEEKLTKPGVKR